MLKMIIADDELIVRRGLMNIMPWNELGIEVIAGAADGEEALELCRQLNPDILLTDIRMPIMDGLEVAMTLNEEESPIRVVLISGAQDFHFAKTALNVDVEGYILKPIKIDEMQDVFSKVVGRIRMEQNRTTELSDLKRQIHEHMPVIRDNFLRNLVAGAYTSEPVIQNKLEYFAIPLPIDDSCLISVLQIDHYIQRFESSTEEEKQIISFSVSNIIEEILRNHGAGISFSLDENEFVQIYTKQAIEEKKHLEICAEINACLTKFLKISTSIGIGRPVSRALQLHLSLKTAHDALNYKFYEGSNVILDIADIYKANEIAGEQTESSDFSELESRLMGCIRFGDVDGVLRAVDDLFDLLCMNSKKPVDYIQGVCIELVCIASRTVQDFGDNPDQLMETKPVLFDQIYKKEDAESLKAFIAGLFTRLAEHYNAKYNRKNEKIIKQIKDIITQRFSEKLSVLRISGEVFLTPNYISLIFKQETGETITEYLTAVRMENAKQLIKHTDLKIMDIAEKVGYDDPHYFSKAFKKFTGVHPQKYRT